MAGTLPRSQSSSTRLRASSSAPSGGFPRSATRWSAWSSWTSARSPTAKLLASGATTIPRRSRVDRTPEACPGGRASSRNPPLAVGLPTVLERCLPGGAHRLAQTVETPFVDQALEGRKRDLLLEPGVLLEGRA